MGGHGGVRARTSLQLQLRVWRVVEREAREEGRGWLMVGFQHHIRTFKLYSVGMGSHHTKGFKQGVGSDISGKEELSK